MPSIPYRALLVAVPFLVACGQKNEFVAPPPPPVTVASPVQKPLRVWLTATGETAAFRSVEIRARVRGFLEEVVFTPGTDVEKGTRLFVIDKKPYEAIVGIAQADLASAKAELGLAKTNVQKLESVTSGAVSEIAKIEARAKMQVAEAAVAAAESRLRQAELDLSYCEIQSPIRGRISDKLRDVGNLVGANDATLLATVVDSSKVYAWFNVSEQDMLRVKAQHRAKGEKERPDLRKIPCELARMTDEGYPIRGHLDYADPQLDTETGTLRLRALFENQDKLLAAGLFVRVRIPMHDVPEALLVPESALGSDPRGDYLLTVGEGDTVERRSVQLGTREGGLVHVREGITKGDRVIVKGLLRARPGAQVRAVPAGAEKRAPEDQ